MSHRRPTPIPTETALVLGRELQTLPSISESPPEKPDRSFTHSMEALSSSDEKLESTGSSTVTTDDLHVPTITNDTKEKQVNETTSLCKKNGDYEPLVSPGQKTDYIKLHFSTNDLHEICKNDEKKPYQYDEEFIAPVEDIKEALLAAFFVIFHVAWSIGVAFWHMQNEKNLSAGYLTLAIVIVSGVIVQLTYFCNSKIKKRKIWQTSKIMWILFLIPCTLPIFMSISNVFFVANEIKNKSYIRPRTNYRMIFLLESLTLAFPQSVLQLTLMMEDYADFPSVRGVVIGIGIFILTVGITFARVRFDSAKRCGRYGVGLDKWIRYSVLWASKVLWIITYCCVIVSVRLLYGREYSIVSTIVAIGILLALFEIPVLISSIPSCQRCAAACLSLFFLLPQFMALIALIFWVNMDTTIYDYNIGSCILGMFFWVESVCILGWLLDRCTGRDIDFISGYPHFFGNLFTTCCKS